MCVYEGYNKARDCRVDTLVKHEVHRYLSTSEWINAASHNVAQSNDTILSIIINDFKKLILVDFYPIYVALLIFLFFYQFSFLYRQLTMFCKNNINEKNQVAETVCKMLIMFLYFFRKTGNIFPPSFSSI